MSVRRLIRWCRCVVAIALVTSCASTDASEADANGTSDVPSTTHQTEGAAVSTTTSTAPTTGPTPQVVTASTQPTLEPTSTSSASTTTLDEPQIAPSGFTPSISEVTEDRLGLSWDPQCPVGPNELALLTLRYVDMAGQPRIGELIVNVRIADAVLKAFETLYAAQFRIARMETPERYARPEDFGPDRVFIENHGEADLIDDTSGFFCRRATGTSSWSQHALGLAIDINPVQNPYIKGDQVIPLNGKYQPPDPGTLVAGSLAVRIFEGAGLKWGGNWSSLKDYMHFSESGR